MSTNADVEYDSSKPVVLQPNGHAFLVPLNHPDAGSRGIVNGEPAITSRIISVDHTTGIITTRSRVYKPSPPAPLL